MSKKKETEEVTIPAHIAEADFDNENAKPFEIKGIDAPFYAYGSVQKDSRFYAVRMEVTRDGKVKAAKSFFHSEPELEFARDSLGRLLHQDRAITRR